VVGSNSSADSFALLSAEGKKYNFTQIHLCHLSLFRQSRKKSQPSEDDHLFLVKLRPKVELGMNENARTEEERERDKHKILLN
jgi:hypothetical protein